MASLKARLLGSWIGDRLMTDTHVTEVRDVGAKFRFVTVAGDDLRDAPISAGDKVQVYNEEVGSRTYTPFAFEPDRGQFSLLAFLHGDEPGARWARSLSVGTKVRLVGPSTSIALASLAGPVALFGDETSFAVARALLDLRSPSSPTVVLEVTSRADCEIARDALGLPADALVEKRAHDGDAFYADCATRLTRASASIVLTGNARSIQQVRAALRSHPGSFVQKTKPYWSPGKRGLD